MQHRLVGDGEQDMRWTDERILNLVPGYETKNTPAYGVCSAWLLEKRRGRAPFRNGTDASKIDDLNAGASRYGTCIDQHIDNSTKGSMIESKDLGYVN